MNSFILVMEEFSMELTPATNFTTLFVRMEYFNFSIWVTKCSDFYTHYKYAFEIFWNKRKSKIKRQILFISFCSRLFQMHICNVYKKIYNL